MKIWVDFTKFQLLVINLNSMRSNILKKKSQNKKDDSKSVFPQIKLSSNIDSRAVERYFQRPGFLLQKPGKVARFRETSLNERLSRTPIWRPSYFFFIYLLFFFFCILFQFISWSKEKQFCTDDCLFSVGFRSLIKTFRK